MSCPMSNPESQLRCKLEIWALWLLNISIYPTEADATRHSPRLSLLRPKGPAFLSPGQASPRASPWG